MITTYAIAGMTCDHCVRAVTSELMALPSVVSVTVNLESGNADVDSTAALELSLVESAVEEAGYELVNH